jgi:hypothetical protein
VLLTHLEVDRLMCSRIDPLTGTIKKEYNPAHEYVKIADTSVRKLISRAPISRVMCLNENLVASGDDEGVIKVWTPSLV